MDTSSFDLTPSGGPGRATMLALPTPAIDDGEGNGAGQESGASGRDPASSDSPGPQGHRPDCPAPPALTARDVVTWDDSRPAVENYVKIGRQLAKTGDLFRATRYADGLVLASSAPNIPPTPVKSPGQLEALLIDRLHVKAITKEGKLGGWGVPAKHLRTMLASEAFLQEFRPVDRVDKVSRYLPDFSLTRPGYNDGGYGNRLLHVGAAPLVISTYDTIARFLDAMAFATEADRTNALGAAATVMLRDLWPGGKPCLIVTSTKSHGGKETVVLFAAGSTRSASISYQAADWALERSFVGALRHDPEVGLVDIENARLDRGQKFLRSAFLERLITDPEPLLYSTGGGAPLRRRNDLIVAITTNFGNVSEDLLNRGLPIHLAPVGDVAARESPIGNPKLEYLPAHRDRIEAELRGMIERWKREGRPLDDSARHPFGPWAQVVGGILMVNEFSDLLGNYSSRRTADNPTRQALGLLGAARPGEWLRTSEWARLTAGLGLVRAIVPDGDRDSEAGRERGLGVVLSAHRDETLLVENDDARLTLQLEKARRRFDPGDEPTTRYRFRVLERYALLEDADAP